MKILAIDTSADETSASVTENTNILSNVVWSQASLHAKWGGVVPSLAQRQHEERVDWVIERAILNSKVPFMQLDAIAVTVGPGLAIALGVGIDRAKKLAIKWNKPLIAVNHLEAHILSPLAEPKTVGPIKDGKSILKIRLPALGLVVSGGNTQLVLIEKIGKYKILAETMDDALGEALDKAARMLGLGYPGGAILEKFAKKGDPKIYKLPIPLLGEEKKKIFSYSGLKTAMYRLTESEKPLTQKKIYNLSASFQNVAFTHLIRVMRFVIENCKSTTNSGSKIAYPRLFVGGGVCANIELRKRLRELSKDLGLKISFPYTQKLCGDNAAMIGITAFFKAERKQFVKNINQADRVPNAKIDEKLSF